MMFMVVILERASAGGQCVHRIEHHLQPDRRSLSGFVFQYAGVTNILLFCGRILSHL